MFKEIFQETVDKRGVMDTQGKSLDSMGLTKVYLRNKDHRSTPDSKQTKMPYFDQDKIIGWFATKPNNAYGYIVQELTKEEKSEFGGAFRVYSDKGTTIVKFNLPKGKVYFLDNEYYRETDKVKYQSAMAYTRLFVDDTHQAKKAFKV